MAANKLRQIFTWRVLRYYLLIALGCALLAFGDAVFVTPFNLVIGGMISVGIIVQNLVGSAYNVVDIVTWALAFLLLLIGLLFVGKKFALRTLFATIVYPLFFSLFYRVPLVNGMPIGDFLASEIVRTSGTGADNLALLLIVAIFGGSFVGAGVSITYLANGSSGGFDVLCVLCAQHTPIKEGAASFAIDSILILVGIFINKNITCGLIGVLSALVAALVVQYAYVKADRYVVCDIISSKIDAIQAYVHQNMDHASTIVDVTGGYTGQAKKMLRVCIAKNELQEIRSLIREVDPLAFVTFTQASLIHGEGFVPLVMPTEDQSVVETILEKKKQRNKDHE